MKRILGISLVVLLTAACSGGNVLIHAEPPRAYVTINGVSQGVTPLVLDLDCDDHDSYEITASAPGYLTQKQTITCRWLRGLQKNVFFELEPGVEQVADVVAPPKQPTEQYGTLEVKSVPNSAEVFVNDTYLGLTPYVNERMESGTYIIVVRKQGFEAGTRTARITPGLKSSHFIILQSE